MSLLAPSPARLEGAHQPLTGARRQSFETSEAAARRLLGDGEFEHLWSQGDNMTFDQAVDYALSPSAVGR